jgi:putative transposase
MSVIRATKHRQAANAAKLIRLQRFVLDYRAACRGIGAAQMRAWNETGEVPRNHGSKAENARLGAAPAQMAAAQCAELIKSHWSNRQNDFVSAVSRSSLPKDVRSVLYKLNREQKMLHNNDGIDPSTVALAKAIWRGIRKRSRLPDFGGINPRIDVRCATVASAKNAASFKLWMQVRLPRHGKFAVPVQDHAGRQMRKAPLRPCVQIVMDRDQNVSIRLFSDETEAATRTKAAYTPDMEAIGIDFGLRTMFATSEGDLMGGDWIETLKKYDANITRIGAGVQRAGMKPRQSKRYRAAVTRLRGFIETEIRRVLNRIVAVRKPGELVLERLNFANPDLSKRMNRLVQNCGRSVVQAKLADLQDRLGISILEVNPAYTSQECCACHHVAKTNRKSQAGFVCGSCGHAVHADINGARNILARRSWPAAVQRGGKAAALGEIAKRFKTGVSGASAPSDALPLSTRHHLVSVV